MNKQRIKTNVATTAANITYYGGTIGAGLAFHHLLNNSDALAVATLVVFVLTVEGLLRTLLNEVLNVGATEQDQNATTTAVPANTEETAR